MQRKSAEIAARYFFVNILDIRQIIFVKRKFYGIFLFQLVYIVYKLFFGNQFFTADHKRADSVRFRSVIVNGKIPPIFFGFFSVYACTTARSATFPFAFFTRREFHPSAAHSASVDTAPNVAFRR